MARHRVIPLLLVAALLAATSDAAARPPVRSSVLLANHCFAVKPAATKRTLGRFFLKPTGLGTYMLYDRDRRLATADGGSTTEPGPVAEWRIRRVRGRRFRVTATAGGRSLVPGTVRFYKRRGCPRYPEAGVGAKGKPFKGKRRGGGLFGFVDAHLHLTADMRAGGRVIHGQAFDRFGITRALGGDERNHGPNGELDVTGNLLREGSPVGTHDTQGWPGFTGWPRRDTYTHQQTYYAWLKRARAAGERLVVAQTVEDEPLCRIEPVKSQPCDETEAIRLQVERLRGLQDYVDAQSGGRGRGWLRLVYSPRGARRAIRRGKLAVLIGAESSNLFGCSEWMGEPQCSRADVDRGIRQFRRWGIRSVFVAHWTNNAFAGAALEGGDKGTFINALNAIGTGRFFEAEPCPQRGQGEEPVASLPELEALSRVYPALGRLLRGSLPVYPAGPSCNSKGLTELGEYLIEQLIANRFLIETDHMSEKARLQVLAIAERHDYPLVSSHTNTGGFWTASDLKRLYALGGFATARPDHAGALANRILELRAHRRPGRWFGVGLGSDTGGFSELPEPQRLRYPYKSYDRKVTFVCQTTGSRRFDINTDGVAHYGLFPDLLAVMRDRPGGRRALRTMFRSAEAYLRTWERAYAP